MSNNQTRNKLSVGKLAIIGMLIVVLFALEYYLLRGITKVEGVKIGLYNMFIVFAIVNMKTRHAYLFLLIKLIAGSFLAVQVIFYPLAGGILSIAAMSICSRFFKDRIGYIGISIIGALIYNAAVYAIAAVSLHSVAVLYNIPIILLLSVIYGALTGSFAFVIAKTDILHLGIGERDE